MTDSAGRAGKIVTFYSFKGGVGRSMALANIAAILAGWGRRVLCVDWDLEAAGLHRYFQARLPEGWVPTQGLLDVVERRVDWRSVTTRVDLPGKGHLDLLPAGTAAPDFVARLQVFDWEEAYGDDALGERIEALREEWADTYDFVLLDSRTGLSDIGGICTVQLPDILVMLFAANWQSLEGTLDVAARAAAGREELPVTRASLMVLPVLARFEGRTEVEKAREWLEICANRLPPLYTGWLDRDVTPGARAGAGRVRETGGVGSWVLRLWDGAGGPRGVGRTRAAWLLGEILGRLRAAGGQPGEGQGGVRTS